MSQWQFFAPWGAFQLVEELWFVSPVAVTYLSFCCDARVAATYRILKLNDYFSSAVLIFARLSRRMLSDRDNIPFHLIYRMLAGNYPLLMRGLCVGHEEQIGVFGHGPCGCEQSMGLSAVMGLVVEEVGDESPGRLRCGASPCQI